MTARRCFGWMFLPWLVLTTAISLDLFVKEQYWCSSITTEGEDRFLVDAFDSRKQPCTSPYITTDVFVGGKCYQPWLLEMPLSDAYAKTQFDGFDLLGFVYGTLSDGSICRQGFPNCTEDTIFSATTSNDCDEIWTSNQLYVMDEYRSTKVIHFPDWCISPSNDDNMASSYTLPIVEIKSCYDKKGPELDFSADFARAPCRPSNFGKYDDGIWKVGFTKWYCDGGNFVQEDSFDPDCSQTTPHESDWGWITTPTCPETPDYKEYSVQCESPTALCKDFSNIADGTPGISIGSRGILPSLGPLSILTLVCVLSVVS